MITLDDIKDILRLNRENLGLEPPNEYYYSLPRLKALFKKLLIERDEPYQDLQDAIISRLLELCSKKDNLEIFTSSIARMDYLIPYAMPSLKPFDYFKFSHLVSDEFKRMDIFIDISTNYIIKEIKTGLRKIDDLEILIDVLAALN
jgi:hypothetical protein